MIDQALKDKIANILKRYEVIRASIFGSYVRNEATKESDIDILVELPETKTLLDLIDLKFSLEDELCIDVDLLTYDSLSPKLKEKIIEEKVELS